jgi:ribosomal protein S19
VTDKYRTIQFSQDADGTVSVVGIWHRDIMMSPEMLGSSIVQITDEGHVRFAVQNGGAVYKLSKTQQRMSHAMALERVSYETK